MARTRVGAKRLNLAATAAVLAVTILPIPAFAQAVPPTVSVPTREELENIARPQADQQPQLAIKGGIERSPCPLADPQYADIPVTIDSVVFNNLKGASPEELEPAWKPFAGKPQPVGVICERCRASARCSKQRLKETSQCPPLPPHQRRTALMFVR